MYARPTIISLSQSVSYCTYETNLIIQTSGNTVFCSHV